MERRDTFRRIVLWLVLIALVAVPHQAWAADTFKPFKLKTVDGVERRLSDVLGKATLVVFFFPTCIFCNAALPSIQRLHDTYTKEGLSTVWINVVPQEEPLVPAWQMKHGYTVPILLGTRSAQNDYRLTMTPTYYLLDSRGHVLLRHAGYKAGDDGDLEREIRRILVSAE